MFTDDLILYLLDTGVLVDNIKEVVPPLAYRLLLLAKLNEEKSRSSNSTPAASVRQRDDGTSAAAMDVTDQVTCNLCSNKIQKDWESIWIHL
jgi:hypothetical protein